MSMKIRLPSIFLLGGCGVLFLAGTSGLGAQEIDGIKIPKSGKLYPRGVNARIERAIRKGAEFLVRTQNRDGSWRANGSSNGYPVAMTSLAGFALMATGSTPMRGPYAPNIRKAADFLMRHSLKSGLISVLQEEERPMYGHGFAMLFLAEVYGMEVDLKMQRKLRRVLDKAIRLTAKSQSSYGGWNYAPGDNYDEGSVTVTQVQGLRACRNAGINVPKKVIQNAIKYIADSANEDGGIRYGARFRGPSRPAITAAACAVLYNAGKYDDKMAIKAMKYAQSHLSPTRSGGFHFYAQLYFSEALYQKGGKDWDRYYKEISEYMLKRQSSKGSWQGDGVGLTYGTAIALIILNLPYAHLPILQR
ncbi:MAG TPA: hypothetical protein ENK02_03030 [Planctomycetes bacterium]|nr:hypothetical protein [Planctomycetota bacterium]